MEKAATTPELIRGSPLDRVQSYGLPKFEDPFSDDELEPFTPMTEVSNYELSIQAIPEKPSDAEQSTVTCCRCDYVNSFEPETRGSATCEYRSGPTGDVEAVGGRKSSGAWASAVGNTAGRANPSQTAGDYQR